MAWIRSAAALALAGGFVAAGFTAGVRGDGTAVAGATDWPMWGGTPSRNMVSAATGLPDKWDVKTKANVKWVADLGSQSYGNATVAGGRVFVGTNNELLRDPKLAGDKVREEAAEVVKAVNSESEERVAEEGADVVYHLAVLLLSRGVSMAEVLHVLNGRRKAR
jgi:phosphoribosyl-ATP pyrophosphohydrolase